MDIDSAITSALNAKRALDEKTRYAKTSFIVEMKSGLGDVIKENPYKVTFVKKPWRVRFMARLNQIIRNIFTKF